MENLEQNEQVVAEETKPSPLHTITPLSKYLAMGLFVVLPFLGGWIGYSYAPEKIVEVERIITQEVKIDALENTKETIRITTEETPSNITKKEAVLDHYLLENCIQNQCEYFIQNQQGEDTTNLTDSFKRKNDGSLVLSQLQYVNSDVGLIYFTVRPPESGGLSLAVYNLKEDSFETVDFYRPSGQITKNGYFILAEPEGTSINVYDLHSLNIVQTIEIVDGTVLYDGGYLDGVYDIEINESQLNSTTIMYGVHHKDRVHTEEGGFTPYDYSFIEYKSFEVSRTE